MSDAGCSDLCKHGNHPLNSLHTRCPPGTLLSECRVISRTISADRRLAYSSLLVKFRVIVFLRAGGVQCCTPFVSVPTAVALNWFFNDRWFCILHGTASYFLPRPGRFLSLRWPNLFALASGEFLFYLNFLHRVHKVDTFSSSGYILSKVVSPILLSNARCLPRRFFS